MEQPTPARATSGKTVGQAMARFGNKLALDSSDENGIKTARDFQSGLNMIKGKATPSLFEKLKIDGLIGPKTRQAARTILTKLPSGSLENGLALGRFKTFAEGAGRGSVTPATLRRTTSNIFGPLYGRSGKPGNKASYEGLGLQASLNDVGRRIFDRDRFRPLLEDGFIGPKTAAAFSSTLKSADPFRFVANLGRNLGLF